MEKRKLYPVFAVFLIGLMIAGYQLRASGPSERKVAEQKITEATRVAFNDRYMPENFTVRKYERTPSWNRSKTVEVYGNRWVKMEKKIEVYTPAGEEIKDGEIEEVKYQVFGQLEMEGNETLVEATKQNTANVMSFKYSDLGCEKAMKGGLPNLRCTYKDIEDGKKVEYGVTSFPRKDGIGIWIMGRVKMLETRGGER